MSADQRPEDVAGPLGWAPAGHVQRPLCPLCGTRWFCERCDPDGYQQRVERIVRAGLESGEIKLSERTYYKLDATARKEAARYLAQCEEARLAGGRAA